MVTMAHSESPWSPFKAHPRNSILIHRDRPELPLQATGHGDLVQAEAEHWWMLLLGVRPLARQHHLGRETLLRPVDWDAEGWLSVNNGQPLQEHMTATGLPAAKKWFAAPIPDEFNASQLVVLEG